MKIKVNWEIVKVFVGSVAFTVVLSMCARNMIKKDECNIECRHAHKFSNLYGLTRYAEDCSFIHKWLYKSSDQYIEIDDSNELLIKFLDENNLYSIKDNLELLEDKISKHNPYTEYEINNNNEISYVKNIKSLEELYTGNARDCYYVYKACKIEKDSDQYKIIKNDNISNLFDEMNEYPYIDGNYYEIKYSNTYKLDINNGKER